MPFNLRGPEILILVLIILLLFGAKRLPDVARGLGRSLRIFKAETKEMQSDAPEAAPDAPAAVEAPAPPATPAQAAAPATAPPPERTET
ncbi:MAG: Sec-independent protein translocase subunit TatA [Candidatus Nanopelagicales bacterium]